MPTTKMSGRPSLSMSLKSVPMAAIDFPFSLYATPARIAFSVNVPLPLLWNRKLR